MSRNEHEYARITEGSHPGLAGAERYTRVHMPDGTVEEFEGRRSVVIVNEMAIAGWDLASTGGGNPMEVWLRRATQPAQRPSNPSRDW